MSFGRFAALTASASSALGLLWHAFSQALEVGREGVDVCHRVSTLVAADVIPFCISCPPCSLGAATAIASSAFAVGVVTGVCLHRRPVVCVRAGGGGSCSSTSTELLDAPPSTSERILSIPLASEDGAASPDDRAPRLRATRKRAGGGRDLGALYAA